MKTLAAILALLAQAPQSAPLVEMRSTLRQLRDQFGERKATYGAAPELTAAKHQFRNWIESRLAGQGENIDTGAFEGMLDAELAGAGLFCSDYQFECLSNLLGYVDDIRVYRKDELLAVVTATGIYCGYDESAYVYAWGGRQWRRIWETEQNTYTPQGYLPQTIYDLQVSAPRANGSRLIMTLGSQTMCGASYRGLYVRAWRLDADYRSESVLDWTARGNDGYPPIRGRLLPDDVLFEFSDGGFLSGAFHTAVRHFRIEQGAAVQVDPIGGRPRDFVLEWLAAPWEQSRTLSESASLEKWHAQLLNKDGVGDFPEPTLRCAAGPDLWQVATRLYERPRMYYRVRWQEPYSFVIAGISETPYPDCTVVDSRADAYPSLLELDQATSR